ncbi:MAG: Arginine-tRNA ligase [candidate division CPR2 bacterium GW2011_GWC1_41_48]|uniref:Arginine--tRNA ligase n=1 Tax=candidate division CPR2 bacterium GW2011_GWC1_41_48 TaxID=1618344 RepID=A0A0G0W6X3_UNCC2|nr:MAG: Arginine-tRNA ligase [candidate division CPR2 bacterium GW2011_GWC2_39_35]KKS08705.1 MAG: Arginine-tRNA ligase [candidate division CPR2 bacterium GW2011_GWC1_41_48]
MIKDDIFLLVEKSLRRLADENLISVIHPELIVVGHAKDSRFGDFSTNIAMRMAKDYGQPLELASLIIKNLPEDPRFEKIEALPPGFINFYLSVNARSEALIEIMEKGSDYGNLDLGKGKKVNIDYLSANPTGPVHIGNARGIIGYTIANVLTKAGYEVEKEFYVNDIGGQANKFARTLVYWFKTELGETVEFPEGGYPGEFYRELSNKVVQLLGKDKLLAQKPEEIEGTFRRVGMELSVALIKETVCNLKVDFDRWVSEEDVQKSFTEKVFKVLEQNGYTKESEGAVWFTSPDFEDLAEKESVLKKSDGTYTYFMDDIAYHWNRFINKKFDLIIDVQGSNHHGHIARMKAAMKAIGVDPEKLQFVLYQFVRLKQGAEVLRMAKREGTFVTADQVVSEVPSDVLKFFFLLRAPDSHLDFDLELAKNTTAQNPLYYVQYALARLHGILRQAESVSDNQMNINFKDADLSKLKEPEEIAVITDLMLFPEIIEEISFNFQVQKLPYYAIELANKLHSFYDKHRVLSEDAELTKARLYLVKAASIVLAETLMVIGVEAPERM